MTARLSRFLVANRRRLDTALREILPPATSTPRTLHRAMRYGVLAGGKRLRPAVTVLAWRAAGGRGRGVLPVACAVELVHAFSLIHDDLPCLDDDALRRGRPTVHRRFGEAIALLAGDALLALAFACVCRVPAGPRQRSLVAELAEATGSRGMIGGQALEESLGSRPGKRARENVHRLKTARLFEAAAALGGLAAGAPGALLTRLGRYGRALGLAYQLADDLVDGDGARSGAGTRATRRSLAHATDQARRLAGGLTPKARVLYEDLADFVSARAG